MGTRIGRLLLGGMLAATPLAARHARAQGDMLRDFDHTAWTARDGVPPNLFVLAQTSDGVLWLAGQSGLYRFDGVRFERFAPAAGQRLASLRIHTLYADPDGALWIGYTFGGASVLAHNRLTHYAAGAGLPPNSVLGFARDSAGGLWAATMGGLARLVGGRWQRVAPDPGRPDAAVYAVFVDRRGTVWASGATGCFALPRGARAFTRRASSLRREYDTVLFGEAADGSVWGWAQGVGFTPLADARGGIPPSRLHPVHGPASGAGDARARPDALLVDGDGRAWLGIPGTAVWLSAAPPRAGRRPRRPWPQAAPCCRPCRRAALREPW